METRANYALVGAFALAVIAATFGFVYWIAGPANRGSRALYNVIFTGSVSGLSRGAMVTFNGLNVGDVRELELNKANPNQVIAHIEIDTKAPIKADTKAQLEFQGLTGVASIGLSGGSSGSPPLRAGSDGSPPILWAAPSQFQNLLETAQNVSRQLSDLSDKANKIVDQNAENVTQTIQNAERFSAALASNTQNIQDFMNVMTGVGRALKPLSGKLEAMATQADEILHSVNPDKVKETTENIRTASINLNSVLTSLDKYLNSSSSTGMLSQVNDAARAITRLADDLDAQLKGITQNLSHFTGPGLQQYQALAGDARKTLDQLNRVLRSFEKDPNQIVFGAKPALPEYHGP